MLMRLWFLFVRLGLPMVFALGVVAAVFAFFALLWLFIAGLLLFCLRWLHPNEGHQDRMFRLARARKCYAGTVAGAIVGFFTLGFLTLFAPTDARIWCAAVGFVAGAICGGVLGFMEGTGEWRHRQAENTLAEQRVTVDAASLSLVAAVAGPLIWVVIAVGLWVFENHLTGTSPIKDASVATRYELFSALYNTLPYVFMVSVFAAPLVFLWKVRFSHFPRSLPVLRVKEVEE